MLTLRLRSRPVTSGAALLGAAALMSLSAASAPPAGGPSAHDPATQVLSVRAGQVAQVEPAALVTGAVADEAYTGLPGAGGISSVAVGGTGIPARVLAAYRSAADASALTHPGCGVTWWLLAGIGKVESGHAAGGRVDDSGRTRGEILGPRLDGSLAGTRVIRDSDGGAMDGDPLYDRAVGPMQFLPGTWAAFGRDADGNGRADPHNVDDAALAAAAYLCHGGASLGDEAGMRTALMRYNASTVYGSKVLSWAYAYRDGVRPEPGAPGVVAPPAAGAAGPVVGGPVGAAGAGVAPASPPAAAPAPAAPAPAAPASPAAPEPAPPTAPPPTAPPTTAPPTTPPPTTAPPPTPPPTTAEPTDPTDPTDPVEEPPPTCPTPPDPADDPGEPGAEPGTDPGTEPGSEPAEPPTSETAAPTGDPTGDPTANPTADPTEDPEDPCAPVEPVEPGEEEPPAPAPTVTPATEPPA